ncbi:MAG: AmmeMemoRadiSam system protein B, partial [Candidatus Anstonellales archaeon]
FSYTASLDEIAHLTEHSIEVQLPFLQKLNPKAKIVCISMMAQNLEASLDIGKAIFEATKNRNVIVIASSDFTHYKSAEQASVLDASALEKIQTLEVEGFQREVESKNLSICGYGPISAAMHYSKLKGAKMAELLRYSNSGEVTGDYSNVVAYASLAIRK